MTGNHTEDPRRFEEVAPGKILFIGFNLFDAFHIEGEEEEDTEEEDK